MPFLFLILLGLGAFFFYIYTTVEQLKKAIREEAARNRKFRSLVTVSLKKEHFPDSVRRQAATVAAQHGFDAVVDGLERDIGIERESAASLARQLTSDN